MNGETVCISGTTSYNGTWVITYVDDENYKIETAFVADDATGTSNWTSEQYIYRFAIPTSLRIASVQIGGVDITDWVREGAYILTNQESTQLDMAYVYSVTDTSLFPSHFVDALWLSLAVELTYDIIQSSAHSERLITELIDIVLPKAIAMDEQERYIEEEDQSWVEAGHIGNNYYGRTYYGK